MPRQTGSRKTSGGLQKAVIASLDGLPRIFLERKIEAKLHAAGIQATPARVKRVADAIMAGTQEFILDDKEPDLDVELAFDDNDIAEMTNEIERFCKNELPNIVVGVSKRTAADVVKTLKANWPERKAWEQGLQASFGKGLEYRWGEAFDAFSMLLAVARELGEEYLSSYQRSRAKKNRHKRDILSRLHARACQVADEVLALLKSGFADGAMARWRTLHEIVIVATLIADHDDELAERYLLHDVVEAKRALDTYETVYADLGYRPPSKRAAARTQKSFDAVKDRFGKQFCSQYGWAAKHLRIGKPTFADLEKAAQRSMMRSHYKLASQNIHAGVKGITDRLGLLEGWTDFLLSGASNAGLEEPGQHAVISLGQITVLLLGQRPQIEDAVTANTLLRLQQDAVDAFIKAARKLQRDENAIVRVELIKGAGKRSA